MDGPGREHAIVDQQIQKRADVCVQTAQEMGWEGPEAQKSFNPLQYDNAIAVRAALIV